ncbi:hypothetical protein [Pusillimonas sp. NJUB218]|uniref:hypothetical protein n=1 Tax=Pusillimonas sp. NJUB218 TaxID=2023230 RepID=UPI001F30DA59|nr:hypothetical protein [Pusillimonas sp. NJUB218]
MLDPQHWQCIGLRRRQMALESDDPVTWYRADLQDPASLSFLGDGAFARVTHVLYAPSPDSRTSADYASVYPQGLSRLLGSLSAQCLAQLKRCVLVGSSVVWGPSDDWVNEDSPVQATNFRAQAILDAEAALHTMLPRGVGVALRLSGLYGPGRSYLVNGLRSGTVVAPDGPGHWANRIHIDDAARACAHLLALNAPEPLYIGTDDHPMPIAEFYDAVARLAGVSAPQRQPKSPDGKRLSNARLRASGWVPTWPNALDWYASTLGALKGGVEVN